MESPCECCKDFINTSLLILETVDYYGNVLSRVYHLHICTYVTSKISNYDNNYTIVPPTG